MSLTAGTIPQVFNRQINPADGPIFILVVVCRPLPTKGSGTQRLRGKLTDGKYESQMSVIVTDKNLEKGDLLKIKHWNITGNNEKEKMLFQVEEFDVEKKGFPVPKNAKMWKYGDPYEKPAKPASAPKKAAAPVARGNNKENAKPSTDNGRYMSVMTLTPYMNKWAIKARVIQKGALKEYTNAKGAGKLFSFTVDDGTCDMKISVFNEEVDKFFNIVEKGKVISITNGSLKPKNAQWNHTNHDYECTLGRMTVLEEVIDDCDDIPQMSFNFEPISKIISDRAKGAFVDVCAVINNVGAVDTINTRAGKQLEKRDLELVDDSTKEKMRCTLWGQQALEFDASRGQVLAVKAAGVGEFQGKTLSVGRDSEIIVGFAEEYGERLNVWWTQEGQDAAFEGQSGAGMSGGRKNQMVLLNTLLNGANYQEDDKPYWFNTKCYLSYIRKERMIYKGCPGKDDAKCNKKLIEEDDGMYRCEKCNQNYQNFNYRIMMNASVADGVGSHFVTFFGDTAEQILGKPAQDLGEMFNSDGNEFDDFINTKTCLEFILGGRAKSEIYQDEQRLKVAANRIAQIDYNKYGLDLISRLQECEPKQGSF